MHIHSINTRHALLLSLMTITRERGPIIQDGRLVGALTHVLVNDPTGDYGISIENMLEAAK